MADLLPKRIILSRKQIIKFIELYRMQPCLWDMKNNNYRVKSKKMQAVRNIVNEFKECCPEVSSEYVIKKIESIRASRRKEKQKIRQQYTKKNGGTRQRLWYYNLLSFLDSNGYQNHQRDDNSVNISTRFMSITSDTDLSENLKQEKSDEDDSEIEDDDIGNQESESYVTFDNISRSNLMEIADTSTASAKRYQGHEEEKGKRHCTEIEDEYDAIGINVAAKLRNLPPNMRIVAEKLINDVLYQAQTNGLNSSSVITTPDPFK